MEGVAVTLFDSHHIWSWVKVTESCWLVHNKHPLVEEGCPIPVFEHVYIVTLDLGKLMT